MLSTHSDGDEKLAGPRCDDFACPRAFEVPVIFIIEAAQRLPARHSEDRLGGAPVEHHVKLSHPPLDLLLAGSVVAGPDQARLTVLRGASYARQVDELVALDGFSATFVLPATHLHNDVHQVTLGTTPP